MVKKSKLLGGKESQLLGHTCVKTEIPYWECKRGERKKEEAGEDNDQSCRRLWGRKPVWGNEKRTHGVGWSGGKVHGRVGVEETTNEWTISSNLWIPLFFTTFGIIYEART